MNCSTCEIGWRKQITKQIRQNVKQHDNSEYDLVSNICNFFNCTDEAIFSKKVNIVNYSARDLYTFVMIRYLERKAVDVAKILNMPESNISRVMAKMSAKFKSEIVRNKYKCLINSK